MSESINRRLDRIEQAAKTAGVNVCPVCGNGDGKIELLPIALSEHGEAIEPPQPCPLCGVEPISLGPIVFDGGKVVR